MKDELLDIVDINDNIVGQKLRSVVYRERLSSFRVVNAFLVNSGGKIWIPRRTADKELFAEGLDVSAGGHVKSGECYEEALARELREELAMDIEKFDYHLLGYLTPYKDGVSAFMKVYEIQTDQTPNYNTTDFTEAFWLTPCELWEIIQRGAFRKGDLPILVKIFYLSR